MQHPIRKVLANSQLFQIWLSLFRSIPPKHPSNFISLHLKGLNTPLWWNGRHSGLKIQRARRSTQSEKCLQTANFFNLIFLCVGTSLQHIPPTSYPSIGGIEYAAMVELVDTRDLKSRSGFQSTGSSPVSGTILLILRAVYCSENYFLGKIERIALAEDSLLFSSKWV